MVFFKWLYAFILQILSRNKPAAKKDGTGSTSKEKDKKSMPSLEDFIKARDYTGAVTLLEVGCNHIINSVRFIEMF